MFRKYADFEAFERVMMEGHQQHPIRILSFGAYGTSSGPATQSEPIRERNGKLTTCRLAASECHANQLTLG